MAKQQQQQQQQQQAQPGFDPAQAVVAARAAEREAKRALEAAPKAQHAAKQAQFEEAHATRLQAERMLRSLRKLGEAAPAARRRLDDLAVERTTPAQAARAVRAARPARKASGPIARAAEAPAAVESSAAFSIEEAVEPSTRAEAQLSAAAGRPRVVGIDFDGSLVRVTLEVDGGTAVRALLGLLGVGKA